MDITQSIFTPGQGEFQRLMIETNVGGGTELAPWLLRRPFPDHPPLFLQPRLDSRCLSSGRARPIPAGNLALNARNAWGIRDGKYQQYTSDDATRGGIRDATRFRVTKQRYISWGFLLGDLSEVGAQKGLAAQVTKKY